MDEVEPRQRGRVWKKLGAYLAPVLLYGILASCLVAPAYLDSRERIIGGGELGGWLWRYWWMKIEIVALNIKMPDDLLGRFFNMVSLGRFPETGNITDLYAISVPLDLIFGHPGHYNAKVWLILFADAMAAYAYVLYLTGRRGVSLIAGLTFACNTFVFYEVQRSGLRQALVCFIPLFALFLDRMLRERRLWLGVATGTAFAATAVFYWFFGLFMAIYGLLRFLHYVLTHREQRRRELVAPILVAAIIAAALVFPFMLPYVAKAYQDPHASQLPEVTFFKDFPSLKELQNAPLRPNTKAENLLSSLARVLGSSWSIDWAVNPLQSWVVPVVMVVFGIGLGVARFRKTGFWVLLFFLFYSLTWGPYLAWNGTYTLIGGEYTVRLPYWYAFKFIPMMSRLFAPYRMGAVAVFAMTVLLGLNLAHLSIRLERRPRLRFWLGCLLALTYLGQFALDPRRMLGTGSNKMLPFQASEVTVPPWYHRLAKIRGKIGIIELPMDRQQDLINYYQVVHAKKVMGGWATPGALPPVLRFDKKPNEVTALLLWLSRPEGLDSNGFVQALRGLNVKPYALADFTDPSVSAVYKKGYRYIVLHELGCYMQEPKWGKELYQRVKNQLEAHFGAPLTEFVEFESTANSREMIPILNGMAWVPSIYSPLLIPEPRPVPLSMVIYALPDSTGSTKAAREALEGSGKETTGAATTGKDAAGKDAAGKDAAGKDAAGKDAAGKDALGKDAVGKDAAGKDAAGKDAVGKDAVGKDAAGKDAAGKDAGSKGAAGKDAVGKDAVGKDAVGKDAVGKDATGKDAAGLKSQRTTQGAAPTPAQSVRPPP